MRMKNSGLLVKGGRRGFGQWMDSRDQGVSLILARMNFFVADETVPEVRKVR